MWCQLFIATIIAAIKGGGRGECGEEGCCACGGWVPPAPAPPLPLPFRALDLSAPHLLRSNPLYTEEEEQEVVINVDSLESIGGENLETPKVPRRVPSDSSGYTSGIGNNDRVPSSVPKNEEFPAETDRTRPCDSDATVDSHHTSDTESSADTLSKSMKNDIRRYLGTCRWEKDVNEVVQAAVRGAGGVNTARARLQAALLALNETPSIPNRGPSLPFYGPGVRPGDVTMMPKNTEMSLLAASAMFTLDGARCEALSRRLIRRERTRTRCKLLLMLIAFLLLLAAVIAVELVMSRGQRMFGTVLQ